MKIVNRLKEVVRMYPKCDKTIRIKTTERGYRIPLFCYLCLTGKTGMPIEYRAKCLIKCPSIENAKLGAII